MLHPDLINLQFRYKDWEIDVVCCRSSLVGHLSVNLCFEVYLGDENITEEINTTEMINIHQAALKAIDEIRQTLKTELNLKIS